MRINIAIDGPSAAGKSTIAKILASEIGYAHLDTGAMYRCVAYYASIHNIDPNNEEKVALLIPDIQIFFDSAGHVFMNEQNVSKEIRENTISMMASKVSAHPKVREQLVSRQQEMAKSKGYIMDGRDIGTVVLKDAEVKLFLVASVDSRAMRRFLEYQEKQIEANYDEIYKDIERRDYQDTHRKTSPLKKADDAVEIDTSNLTIEEVICVIRKLIPSKILRNNAR